MISGSLESNLFWGKGEKTHVCSIFIYGDSAKQTFAQQKVRGYKLYRLFHRQSEQGFLLNECCLHGLFLNKFLPGPWLLDWFSGAILVLFLPFSRLSVFQMHTFHVITLFPQLISSYCETSIVGRGQKAGKIEVKTYNPRDFCTDNYRRVDDTPYGGGAGMVLKPEPFYRTFEAIERKRENSPVIIMTPQGVPFKHKFAQALSCEDELTIFCGHYEGFDERIRKLATEEYSIGDYVLTGGELPALVIVDAVSRLVPGVVGKNASVVDESFADGLLEGPQYTKPAEFRGMVVPEVIRSGDHKEIARWRRQEALRRTAQRRPDLIASLDLSEEDRKFLSDI